MEAGTLDDLIMRNKLNATSQNSEDILRAALELKTQKEFSASLEKSFGVFFVVAGIIGFCMNLLVLIVVKFLRKHNAVFMIITNFAVIDLMKAFCAIYMGSVMISLYFSPGGTLNFFGPRPHVRMLQTSIFMLHFGNVCSVFNLMLAAINEFLFIKLPLHYRKLITRIKMTIAIGMTWFFAMVFTIARIFSYTPSVTSQVSISNSTGDNDSATLFWTQGGYSVRRSPAAYAEFADIYSLVLISCLLLCIILILAVYAKLYMIIKQSVNFGQNHSSARTPPSIRRAGSLEPDSEEIISLDHVFGKLSPTQAARPVARKNAFAIQHAASFGGPKSPRLTSKDSFSFFKRGTSFDAQQPYRLSSGGASQSPNGRKSIKRVQSVDHSASRKVSSSPSPTAVARQHCVLKRQKTDGYFNQTVPSAAGRPNLERRMSSRYLAVKASQFISSVTPFIRQSVSDREKAVRFRILRRYKYVIVILTVCVLYATYLALYFVLQLLHLLTLRQGVTVTQLRQYYLTQFILRALFVIHAILNPLVFFRIRTFQQGFSALVTCILRIAFCRERPFDRLKMVRTITDPKSLFPNNDSNYISTNKELSGAA